MMLISLLVEGTCHIPLIRVNCPCIPDVEMLETRISLASPLLALRGAWEAGIMLLLLMLNCLFNVTPINDISVIYVTAHRCAGGLKKNV